MAADPSLLDQMQARLKQPIPAGVIQGLLGQLITPIPGMQPQAPGTQPGGPTDGIPISPVFTQNGLPTPSQQPGPAPQPPQQGQPMPEGTPAQQGGEQGKNESGLNDEQAEMLRSLMSDPKARKDVESIVRQVGGNQRNQGRLGVDPERLLQMAQGWNARLSVLGEHLAAQRGQSPGSSAATDEALLMIFYATPIDPTSPEKKPRFMPLEEIDDYANAVRRHCILTENMKDPEKIEDRVVRECFPMRELLIKTGREGQWQAQVDFVQDMLDLTDRWLRKKKRLPRPDLKVLQATKQGKGDPEAMARDEDSESLPA
jgi:hypothetical protein